jgi:undecaprenyl-diphosphatase
MTGSSTSPPTPNTQIDEPFFTHPTSLLAAALALLTLGICCVALLQLDVSLLRFFRSLNLSSVQRLGDWGEKIGNGASLVGVSLCILAIGWFAGRRSWMQAGLESLLAHGCVGLIVNGLKHLIGRPRPRLTHSGEWQWWPSWDSGLDSFPSGHSSAIFAVVTVLMKHWPWATWPGYALASWVAMSRVWRGSHFLADVVTGMVMGVVVGTIFAGPLREWRQLLLRALVRVTPTVVIITSLLWLMLRRIDNVSMDRLLLILGFGLIATGLGMQWRIHRHARLHRVAGLARLSIIMISMGLALTTGSILPVAVSALAAAVWWIHTRDVRAIEGSTPRDAACIEEPRITVLGAVGIVVAALLIRQLQGIIPIR